MANTLKLFALILIALRLAAQAGNTLTIPFNGVPTGNCTFIMLAVDRTNHDQYFCPAGAWLKITSGGGGGISSFNGLVAAGQTVVNDTNITWTSSAPSTHTLGFAGTLAASRLNPNVVQAIANDTNVTGTISAQTLTLGWAGALAVARGGLGVSLSGTGGAHQFLRQNSVGANITVVQPACGDLSDAVASCNTDATNASNITSGSLPLGRLPWTTRGDLLTLGAGPTPTRIAIGANGQCLTSNGTDWVPGSCATGSIGGVGSSITYSVFTGAATIGNGHITEDNTTNQLTATKSFTTPAPSPVSFSQNPTFDLATCNRCEMAQMTNNVNSVTFKNAKAGLKFSLTLQNGASGGFIATGYTIAGGTVTNVCGLSPAANVRTTQEFEVASDGVTVRGGSCYSDETASVVRGSERAAPSDTPANAAVTCWPDSTDHAGLECRANGSLNTFKLTLSGVDINPVAGQVTSTHLSAALPINQGGSGTTTVLVGFMRGGNPMSAAELTGDSQSNGNFNIVNLRVNGTSYPSNPALNTFPVVTNTIPSQVTYESLPTCNGANQALNATPPAIGCVTISGGGGGGAGTVTNATVSRSAPVVLPLSLNITGTVNFNNTTAPTSMIGGTYQGTNSMPAGYWVGRTIRARLSGIYSTTGTPTFAITMTIGGTTVATFSVTTPNNAANVGWRIECDSTPANSAPLTTVNTSCSFWDGSGTRGFNSQTVSSLNFGSAQAVDVTGTWGAMSMSNTVTTYNASLSVI